MRHLKKRLTVINDGFTKKNCAPARDRINKSINRYVSKMSAKGWIPSHRPSSGNSFFEYEAYIRLMKPKNDSEKIIARTIAEDDGWTYNNGKWEWR